MPENKFILYFCVTLFAIALPVISVAGVYKWTDENGKVHFGDRPPDQGAKEVRIDASPPPSSGIKAREQLERQQRLLQSYDEERQIKAKDKAKTDKLKARREKNCRIARARVENYRTSSYLFERDKEGKKIIYSHEQRAAIEKKAQAEVAHWCK